MGIGIGNRSGKSTPAFLDFLATMMGVNKADAAAIWPVRLATKGFAGRYWDRWKV
jgi:hypothetical protein